MLYTGKLSGGGTFLFALTVNKFNSRLDVYSEYCEENTVSPLNPASLAQKFSRYLQPYLLASVLIEGKGTIRKSYGNIDTVQQVLYLFERSGLMFSMLHGDITEGEYEANGVILSISRSIAEISNVTAIRGLEYTVPENATAHSIALNIHRTCVKSYSDLISSRDMSWYFGPNGQPKKDYRLITTMPEVCQLASELAGYDLVALDTETTGLDFYYYGGNSKYRSRIVGMSLSWKKDQGVYIVFESNTSNHVDFHQCMKCLYDTLNSRTLVCHNGLFDFRVLYSYGYKLRISHDTLLMEFNLDPNVSKGSKGLKMLTRKYLGHETIELDEILGKNFLAEAILDVEPELLKIYACSDTDYTLQIYHILAPYACKMASYYKIDRFLYEVLATAEYHSAKLDENLLHKLSEINKQDLARIEQLMRVYVKEIGMLTQARKIIMQVQGEGYVPTQEEIKALAANPDFRESLADLFTKGKKSKGKQELQFSSVYDTARIMYDILDYPKPFDGSRKTDKKTIQELMAHRTTNPVHFLAADVQSAIATSNIPHSPSEDILISKETLEKYQYPFAYLLSVYRTLYKYRTSFFDTLEHANAHGYYCTNNSMTSAETARVINPIQTLVGSLKNLVVPRDDNWYLIVFDMAQIEFRVMLGLANCYWTKLIETGALPATAQKIAMSKDLSKLIENLNNPESDFHREGGAIFAGCTPEDMTSAQRKKVKAVHFSVPFGADAHSIAEPRMIGLSDSEKQKVLSETEGILSAWRSKQYPLYYFLEYVRDKALIPVDRATLPPNHPGVYGKVSNSIGRYRLFDLADMTAKKRASIRRRTGNFPIQSYARDIFFVAILRLFRRLQREGYITNSMDTDKVVLNLFVHDECVLQVHKSIHPYEMYKYIYEEILTHLTGHPNYYMGIAVCNNWHEGKSDKYEAPIGFVQECIKAYDSNRSAYKNLDYSDTDYCSFVLEGIKEFFSRRVMQEVEAVQGQLGGDPYLIDPKLFLSRFKNYYVRARLSLYNIPCRAEMYKNDSSLDKEQNAIMRSLDYYITTSPNYLKYKIVFNGKALPYSDVISSTADSAEDKLITSDFDFDLGIDSSFTELDEDSFENELSIRDEYFALADFELGDEDSAPREETQTVESNPVPCLWFEDNTGKLVFDITDLSKEQFLALTAYLRQFVTKEGYPLYFFKKDKVINSNVNITKEFSDEEIAKRLFAYTNRF